MSKGIQQIDVKRVRGELLVQGIGRSPKGTKFIIEQFVISDAKMPKEKLKEEISQAAEKLLAKEPIQPW